jgi:hypothetical protein
MQSWPQRILMQPGSCRASSTISAAFSAACPGRGHSAAGDHRLCQSGGDNKVLIDASGLSEAKGIFSIIL